MSQYDKKTAFLSALCLFLAFIEFSLPKPTFIKIGLSNIPLLLALSLNFNFKQFCKLTFMKIFINLVIGGTLFSYVAIMSLASTLCSSILMFILCKLTKKWTTPLGWSVVGALGANIAQLSVASLFLGSQIFSLVNIVMLFGLFTSVATGYIALIVSNSDWFNQLEIKAESITVEIENKKINYKKIIFPFAILILLIINFLVESVLINLVILIFSLILFLSNGKKFKFLPAFILLFSVVFISILQKDGEVLFSIGELQITSHSLFTGLHKGFTLLASFYFSSFIMKKWEKSIISFSKGLISQTFFYWGRINTEFAKTDKNDKIKLRVMNAITNAIKSNF